VILSFWKGLCIFVLALIVVACASQVKPTAKLGEKSLDTFMSDLRWKSFKSAASLMLPEHRQGFIKTFTTLKDIDITDVRLIDLQTLEEGQRFEATVEMEYYLLPSVTLKTFKFDQTWLFFAGDDPAQQGFLIVTPFPDFP
jgi:hypothetical protein